MEITYGFRMTEDDPGGVWGMVQKDYPRPIPTTGGSEPDARFEGSHVDFVIGVREGRGADLAQHAGLEQDVADRPVGHAHAGSAHAVSVIRSQDRIGAVFPAAVLERGLH